MSDTPSRRVRSLFFGTPDFAVPMLETLATRTEVAAAVCQPDRAAGRGMRPRPPPVKRAAERLGVEVWQPRSVRGAAFRERVRQAAVEVAVVVAYGRILPSALLEMPPRGSVNVPASLLPRLRGAAPIHRAILEGEAVSGVALMQLTEGMDEGPVLMDRALELGAEITAGELHDRLQEVGCELLGEYLDGLARGEEPEPRPQDHTRATYAPKLGPGEGAVDWTRPAAEVDRRIRGLSPWPGAHASFRGRRLGLLRSRRVEGEGEPGRVLRLEAEGPVVACGEGAVQLLELKPAGKRAMAAGDWLRGARLEEGETLGQGEGA